MCYKIECDLAINAHTMSSEAFPAEIMQMIIDRCDIRTRLRLSATNSHYREQLIGDNLAKTMDALRGRAANPHWRQFIGVPLYGRDVLRRMPNGDPYITAEACDECGRDSDGRARCGIITEFMFDHVCVSHCNISVCHRRAIIHTYESRFTRMLTYQQYRPRIYANAFSEFMSGIMFAALVLSISIGLVQWSCVAREDRHYPHCDNIELTSYMAWLIILSIMLPVTITVHVFKDGIPIDIAIHYAIAHLLSLISLIMHTDSVSIATILSAPIPHMIIRLVVTGYFIMLFHS